jgi:hypothetical protein
VDLRLVLKRKLKGELQHAIEEPRGEPRGEPKRELLRTCHSRKWGQVGMAQQLVGRPLLDVGRKPSRSRPVSCR